jgi:hypothetical protein
MKNSIFIPTSNKDKEKRVYIILIVMVLHHTHTPGTQSSANVCSSLYVSITGG